MKHLESDHFPMIIDIKRHSLEDGPGIRTVVFLKGCPLSCIFCQNPETQKKTNELGYTEKKCIGCQDCINNCPQKAIKPKYVIRTKKPYKQKKIKIDRNLCTICGVCVTVCPSGALKLVGQTYSPTDLVKEIARDQSFFKHSGGGVTFSGGECLLYPEYLETVLKELRNLNKHVHAAIETAGQFDYEKFKEKVLPLIDLVMFDIKIYDPSLHKKYIGFSNEKILSNFRKLIKDAPHKILARIPLIPHITATEKNLREIAEFLHKVGAPQVSLLPYNPAGFEKCEMIGRKPPKQLPKSFMNAKEEERIVDFFSKIISDFGIAAINLGTPD